MCILTTFIHPIARNARNGRAHKCMFSEKVSDLSRLRHRPRKVGAIWGHLNPKNAPLQNPEFIASEFITFRCFF